MKIRISTVIIWILSVVLTAVQLWLYYRNIWQPGIDTVEFTSLDLARYLPLFDGSDAVTQYSAFHLRWVGLFAFWPLLVIPAHHTLSDFPVGQRVVSLFLRVVLLAVVVLALVDVEKISETSRVSVIYLVDVSASVSDDMLSHAHDEVVKALERRSPETDVQVVTFAEHPRSIDIPANGVLEPFKRHEVDGNSFHRNTNIEEALRYCYALFPENHVRRVVLMGDGNQTQGDVLSEAARARAQDVRIDVVHLKSAPMREIMISAAEVRERDNLRVNKPFEISLQISSTHETDAFLTFEKNDIRDDTNSHAVHLLPGENFISLRAEADAPGTLRCRYALDGIPADEDRFAENNVLSDELVIQGKPKILYIEQNSANASYLQRALAGYETSSGQGFDVEVRGSTGLPSTMGDIMKYSAVILGDVPRENGMGRSNVTTESMNLIQDYVKRQGGGFIAIGGEQAFGPGGYTNTPIERILPVEFRNETPQNNQSSVIALVIDKSGSMQENRNLDIAKEAAKASVGALKAQDRVLVVGFDDAPYIVVPMTRAVNRYSINDKISRMRPNGGTNIRDALEMTYLEMAMVSAKTKHVILLTDGHSSYAGIDNLVREMARTRITVSTVALANADTTLLSRIASLGKGRAYIARDGSSVPRIFVEETNRVANQAIVEMPFVPGVSHNHEMIKGVTLQTLLGYVGTKAKGGSQTILTAPGGAPILAHWTQGTGKATVFTSDAKNRWASAWIRQSGSFAKFWGQVVRATMKTDEETRFDMAVRREGDVIRLMLDAVAEDDRFLNGLDIPVDITMPDGSQRKIGLIQTAPGFYENTLRPDVYGTYRMNADVVQSGKSIGTAQKTFSFPYAVEFAHPEPNLALLDAVAELTEGKVDADFDVSADPGGVKIRTYVPMFYYFLWMALGCIVLDVLSRRMRLGKA